MLRFVAVPQVELLENVSFRIWLFPFFPKTKYLAFICQASALYCVFEPIGLKIGGLPNIARRRLCLFVLPRQNDARHTAASEPDIALQQSTYL
jgi:hypothetical protein